MATDEETPLLEVRKLTTAISFWKTTRRLLTEAYPISLGYMLQSSIQLGTIFVVGRLGAPELAIVGSSFMIATCTAWLVGTGGTTALDVLGSQAIGKSSNNKECGILLQKCLLVTTVLYVPVLLLWSFSANFLLACGQPPELAYGTQSFLRYLAPSGIAYIYFETFKKFLQLQGLSHPCTVILCIIAPLNVALNYVGAHKIGWGMRGGALITGSMYWLACVISLFYICFVNGNQLWGGFSREAFNKLGDFARIVGLGILMIGAEWWAFEVISVAAGTMGATAVAANSIMGTTDTIFAFIPFGLGVATTNHVGRLMGAGLQHEAQIAARSASFIAVVNGALTMTLIGTLRYRIASLYTRDITVIALAAEVFPWGALFQIFDGIQAANSGVLRAIGRSDIGAMANISAYYFVACHFGLFAAFRLGWGLHGLWIGLALALGIVGIVELLVVNKVSWYTLARVKIEDEDEFCS